MSTEEQVNVSGEVSGLSHVRREGVDVSHGPILYLDDITVSYGSNPKSYTFHVVRIYHHDERCTVLSEASGSKWCSAIGVSRIASTVSSTWYDASMFDTMRLSSNRASRTAAEMTNRIVIGRRNRVAKRSAGNESVAASDMAVDDDRRVNRVTPIGSSSRFRSKPSRRGFVVL